MYRDFLVLNVTFMITPFSQIEGLPSGVLRSPQHEPSFINGDNHSPVGGDLQSDSNVSISSIDMRTGAVLVVFFGVPDGPKFLFRNVHLAFHNKPEKNVPQVNKIDTGVLREGFTPG